MKSVDATRGPFGLGDRRVLAPSSARSGEDLDGRVAHTRPVGLWRNDVLSRILMLWFVEPMKPPSTPLCPGV